MLVSLVILATTTSVALPQTGSPLWGQCGGCLPGTAITTAAPPTTTNTPVTTVTATTSSADSSSSNLPATFKWSSSGPPVSPDKSDSHNLAALKKLSIVFYNGAYHVFASTAQDSGYNLVYITFTDFNAANSSTYCDLDQTPIETGCRAAPQEFFIAPQKQMNAAYSTNTDTTNPAGWTAGQNFYASEPSIIASNIGAGFWVDMSGTSSSSLSRESRSLTSTLAIYAATTTNPFARAANVAFTGTPWTKDISHGEMIRTNVDQTMTNSPCNIRYLYQSLFSTAPGDYNSLPSHLALLTATDSPC
ncbi:Alpha-L-arabinofuranosidase C protein [Mycena venus]|uniref:Alpha-L-arabinofuranosidase n=1 Tax=Mycena venus TaxID=2733690 RepID=A0A8H7CZ65_9AGAR|nr:Alpha-L-arabinofuranosidase C protein [Mycena venus]